MVQGIYEKGVSEFTKAVASGATSMVPGVGTAASLVIDAGLLAWDVAEDIIDSTQTEDASDPTEQTSLK